MPTDAMTPSVAATPLTDLLVFGAGGHGRVVADAALLQQAWGLVEASDRDPARCQGLLLPGVPLLDLATALARRSGIHIAIGSNTARQKEALLWSLERLVSVCHTKATVSTFAHIGAGCFIAANAVLAPGASLGAGCIVNHGAVVDHDVRLGAFSHVAPLACLGGGAVLGQRVLVGAAAVVLPGVVIGDDVVIGAGAVVNRPLFEPGIYAGVPARRLT